MGNADSTGAKHNERLSYKRAKVVYNAFRKNGVPKELLQTIAVGEEYPDLITTDNMRQRFNRAVEIYIVTNVDDSEELPLPILFNEAYKEEIKKKKRRGAGNKLNN